MLNWWGKGGRQRPAEGFARAAFCSGTPPRSDRGRDRRARRDFNPKSAIDRGVEPPRHQGTKKYGFSRRHGGHGEKTGDRKQGTGDSFPEARAAFCSGTPPRSDRGGQAGCGPRSRRRGKPRRYKKAIASSRRGRIHDFLLLPAPSALQTRRMDKPQQGATGILPVGIPNPQSRTSCRSGVPLLPVARDRAYWSIHPSTAGVAKLVAAPDLGSGPARGRGSSPLLGTGR